MGLSLSRVLLFLRFTKFGLLTNVCTQWDLSIAEILGPEKQLVVQRFPQFRVFCVHSNLSGPTKQLVFYREVFTIRGVCYIRGPAVPIIIHTSAVKVVLYMCACAPVCMSCIYKRVCIKSAFTIVL